MRRVKHNVAQMIISQSLGNCEDHAFLNVICTAKNATSTESLFHENIPHFTAFMAHQFGQNLGMKHDHVACKCHGQNLCPMHEFLTVDMGFSYCSFDNFHQLLYKHWGDCLFNKPELQSSFGKPYCKRKKKDNKGKESDCGSDC